MIALSGVFESGSFYPHGYCYLWDKGLVWLHVLSDSLIALAYFAIPILLLRVMHKRRDIPFSWMFGLFGVFIIACGMTHVMEVWNLWHAHYWLAGAIKSVTAVASVLTAGCLANVVPKALELPSNLQWVEANVGLRKELQARKDVELDLRTSEAHFRDTAELLDLTHDAILVRDLKNEIIFWNKAAANLYGWQSEELRGQSVHQLLQTVSPQPLQEIERQTLQSGSWEGELEHRRRDGSKISVSSRWALRTDVHGNPIAILESNRDITLRKGEEQRFRNLLEAAPDAVVIVDQAGVIQLVNSQTERLFGYARQEILGHPVEMLVPQRFHQHHVAHRRNYSTAPRTRAMGEGRELYGRRKDGSEFPVEISLATMEIAGGTLVSSSIRDVTQRKAVEARIKEEEEKFRLIVSGVTDYAIYMLDPSGNVISWNVGAERIKGYASEEILGRHFSGFYTEQDIQLRIPWEDLRLATEEGHRESEGWRVRKDGARFWANTVITALYDEAGELKGFGKVTRDMTQRKEIEEKLEKQSRELAHSNLGLVEINKELESFSYSVSHDLRAPLRSIDGFSHALLEDCEDRLNPEEKGHLNRIRAATQRMGALIDDLLNLSRITRSEIHLQAVDLSALARSIVSNLTQTEEKRKVEFTVEDGLQVYADPGLMRVALENLLGNAWKFTAKLEVAHIQFGTATVRTAPAAFFVRDDGAGFDPAYSERLFGAFQRLHATTEFPGTGVGLATVLRIIHRHGGKIWAESAVGKGACFYFTLPGRDS